MSEDVTASNGCGYVEYTPTFKEKFWRRLGFQFHLGEEPKDVDNLPGWMQSRIRFNFSWSDRFRLLLTGKLSVHLTSYFDTPAPSIVKNRTDFNIIPPAGEWY